MYKINDYLRVFIVSVTKFLIVIGHPHTYFLHNWCAVTWVSNYTIQLQRFAIVWFQKISIPPPRRELEIPEGWGVQKPRKFQRGGGGGGGGLTVKLSSRWFIPNQ